MNLSAHRRILIRVLKSGSEYVLPSTMMYNLRNLPSLISAFHSSNNPPSSHMALESRKRESATVTSKPNGRSSTMFPISWVPYAELARIDKPLAVFYLYFPCLFGIMLAASMRDPVIPPTRVLVVNLKFLLGSFLVRCAGCSWNDIVDQDLDRKVARTRNRPMAQRAITTSSALVFTLCQVLVGLGLMYLLLPTSCFRYSVPSILLTGLYPYGKRFTYYPQVILGIVFSWGVIMAFPALDMDLISSPASFTACGSLFLSCIAWTISYDTIYAAQDIRDDLKTAIKSPVVLHRDHTRRVLMVAGLTQVALLCYTGVKMQATPVFFMSSCAGTALTLGKMVTSVDLGDPKDCLWWFKKGCICTGLIISSGFIGEYVIRTM